MFPEIKAISPSDSAVVWSMSGESINGETIAIDGGLLTRGTPALLTGLKKAS
jgi:hypothetical protein